MVIDETGGIHGVRDRGAILSVEALPQQSVFGKELYPTHFLKAAVYCRSIILNHPFLDGNKRTGMTAAMIFLEQNGFMSMCREGEIKNFAIRVASKKVELDAIAAWLKKHSRKIKSSG